jgi:transposase-like protein
VLRLTSSSNGETEVREGARVEREACPRCGSRRYKRNGHIHTGQQTHRGKTCGRAFVLVAENRSVTDEHRALGERLLLARRSRRGICRAVGVSLSGLLHFLVERFQAAPAPLHGEHPGGGQQVLRSQLKAAADEMWSFVGKKTTRQWLWLALEAQTPPVLASPVGDRSCQSAEAV